MSKATPRKSSAAKAPPLKLAKGASSASRRYSALYSTAFLHFETVARFGSVRRAAEALSVAPSAVSHQIAILEREFGMHLFERLARGVRITSAGELLLHHVRRASLELERGRAFVEGLRGLRRGDLAIATTEGLAISPVSETLADFWAEWPNVHVSVLIGTAESSVEAVNNGKAEIGLSFFEYEVTGVRKLAEVNLSVGAVMSPKHPLAQRKSLKVSDLRDVHLLVTGSGTDLPRDLERQFRPKAIDPLRRLTTNSMILQHRVAALGLGVAIKSRMGGMLAEWAADKLVFVPITDLDYNGGRLILFARNEGLLTPAGDAVTKRLQKTMASLR